MEGIVKIFIDTEFTDLVDMDLISIGLVMEDSRAFYAERNDFDVGLCNDFVHSQVLPLLRSPGAMVLSRQDLRNAVDAWLAPFADAEPLICYDHVVDWAQLWDLYDRQAPAWLGQRNIRANLDLDAWASFFKETGLAQHHALNDARANKAAYRKEKSG